MKLKFICIILLWGTKNGKLCGIGSGCESENEEEVKFCKVGFGATPSFFGS